MNRDILKKIDLFGRRVNLRYEGEDLFKTSCGGLSTILLGITLITILIVESMQVWKGEVDSLVFLMKARDPSSSIYAKNVIEYETLAIAAQDFDIMDSSILTTKVTIIKNKEPLNLKNENIELLNDFGGLNLIPCTPKVYKDLSYQFAKEVPKSLKIYCLLVKNTRLHQGYYPQISFLKCKGEQCKSEKEQKKLLSSFRIWSFTKVDQSDHSESKSSSKKRTQIKTGDATPFMAKRFTVSRDFWKSAEIVLREVEIEQKKGFFMPHKVAKSTNQYFGSHSEIVSLSPKTTFFDISLQIEETQKLFILKHYKSFLPILAYLGGLSRGIGIIFFIFVFPIREIMYYRKLMNTIFLICRETEHLKFIQNLVVNGADDGDSPHNMDRSLMGASNQGDSPRRIVALKRGGNGDEERGNGALGDDLKEPGGSRSKQRKGSNCEITDLKQRFIRKRRGMKRKGLMAQMMKKNLDEEQFMENMRNKLLQEGEQGGTSKPKDLLSKILAAGMGGKMIERNEGQMPMVIMMEGEKISRGIQVHDLQMRFGESASSQCEAKMMKLQKNEMAIISKSGVKIGLKKWLQKARSRTNPHNTSQSSSLFSSNQSQRLEGVKEQEEEQVQSVEQGMEERIISSDLSLDQQMQITSAKKGKDSSSGWGPNQQIIPYVSKSLKKKFGVKLETDFCTQEQKYNKSNKNLESSIPPVDPSYPPANNNSVLEASIPEKFNPQNSGSSPPPLTKKKSKKQPKKKPSKRKLIANDHLHINAMLQKVKSISKLPENNLNSKKSLKNKNSEIQLQKMKSNRETPNQLKPTINIIRTSNQDHGNPKSNNPSIQNFNNSQVSGIDSPNYLKTSKVKKGLGEMSFDGSANIDDEKTRLDPDSEYSKLKKEQEQLKLDLSICDIISIFIPNWVMGNSKKTLFTEVRPYPFLSFLLFST